MARQVFAVILIPTETDKPYYSSRVKLDGREFSLRFAWNQFQERWYLTIADETNEVLLAGLKLIGANWPLLKHYQGDERLPQGELVVSDLTGLNTPPAFNELGVGLRCELTYFAITSR